VLFVGQILVAHAVHVLQLVEEAVAEFMDDELLEDVVAELRGPPAPDIKAGLGVLPLGPDLEADVVIPALDMRWLGVLTALPLDVNPPARLMEPGSPVLEPLPYPLLLGGVLLVGQVQRAPWARLG
jgi:hypothetical protein